MNDRYRIGDWVHIQWSEGDDQWAMISKLDPDDSVQPICCGDVYWPFASDIVELCEIHSKRGT